jgi:hypothetical protein
MVHSAEKSKYIDEQKQHIDQSKSISRISSDDIEPEASNLFPDSDTSDRNQRSIVIDGSKPL